MTVLCNSWFWLFFISQRMISGLPISHCASYVNPSSVYYIVLKTATSCSHSSTHSNRWILSFGSYKKNCVRKFEIWYLIAVKCILFKASFHYRCDSINTSTKVTTTLMTFFVNAIGFWVTCLVLPFRKFHSLSFHSPHNAKVTILTNKDPSVCREV